MKGRRIQLVLVFVLSFAALNTYGQATYQGILGQDYTNTITTAVPFLMIAPDARSGALGDAGVASTPDVFSQHWNPAKYAFIKKDMGASVSYSPWLKKLVDDINLAYLTFYKKLGKNDAISASLLYFSLGEIQFTNQIGQSIGTFTPSEYAIDVAYSSKLADKLSGSIGFRYIYSNLTGNIFIGGSETNAGNSVAGDVSVFYQNPMKFQGNDANLALGLNISNIGAKISYSETTEKDFIPTNMRLGACFTTELEGYNSLSFMVDVNKLLVPTPPIYKLNDSTGMPEYGADGKPIIAYGKDPNVGVVSGMFGSFSDAPGGFSEELKEFTISAGVEYWYDKQFALRAGYFYENPGKGNRKYFTLGLGFRLNVFGIDFAYLVPMEQNHPLENTLRFSLLFDFEAFNQLNSLD